MIPSQSITRCVAILVLVGAFASSPQGAIPLANQRTEFDQSTIRFTNDKVSLVGDLLLPEGAGPHPGAVIIQGSGSSSRSNVWARSFAEILASHGIAVLFPDKRGTGESGGDWRTADFHDLALDAAAGYEALGSHPQIDPDKIGFLGLSQGGHIAPEAGLLVPQPAFLISVCASMLTMEETLLHEIEQTCRQRKADTGLIDQILSLARLSFVYIRSGEGWEDYLAQHEEIGRGPRPEAVASWPTKKSSWYWSFWRGIYDYDPVPRWKNVLKKKGTPVLVLLGEQDEQDNVPVERSVERLTKELPDSRVTVHVYPGTGHDLRDPRKRGLRRDVVRDLLGWIREHTDRPRQTPPARK